MAEQDLRQVRIDKLKKFEEKGDEIYPYKFDRTHSLFESSNLPEGTKNISLSGRIMLYRDMGKLAFAQLGDHSGQMQIALQTDEIGKESFKFFHKNFDVGDFVGVKGDIFRTHKGELTLLVKEYRLLAKGLLPLPEKWHGIQDKEMRYRKRHLDLIMNPEVVEVFKKRTQIIKLIRRFLDEKDAMEVENPILESIYGGAFAEPFTTHLNALDIPMYLRISLELPLKKLLVGGFDWVYEMGRVFRNEGVDKSHNPEFTLLEWYKAYADYEETMCLTEELFEYISMNLTGKTEFIYQDKVINVKAPWRRLTMEGAIKEFAGIDVTKMSDSDLLKKADELELHLDDSHKVRGWVINELFEALCEDKLIQPTFITNHPVETTPFCKIDPKNPSTLQRFEMYINGWEIANAYSELNDPLLQRKYLEQQAKALADGDSEATPMNEEYIEALEYGLPPNSGIGFGVDRMIMLFTNSPSIRDVIFSPMMKPDQKTAQSFGNPNDQAQMTNQTQNQKSKDKDSLSPLVGENKREGERNVPKSKLEAGITVDKALKLLKEHCDFSLERHCRTVGASMKVLCKHFQDTDNEEFWEVAGLLHDIDWNSTIDNPENHCGEDTIKMLKDNGATDELIDAMKSHYIFWGIDRNTDVKKALASCDELTGFIVACSLVRPNKMADLTSKSVVKKLKDKAFAAQVCREDMKLCEEYFNIPVKEFIDILIPAIQSVGGDLELM